MSPACIFHLTQHSAGFWAGLFGFMNLFVRALGGIPSDKAGSRWGMRGKGSLLAGALLVEGLGLIVFAHAPNFPVAIAFVLSFALFLKMASGAVYGIVPFISEKNIGLISGVVGAGGNLGLAVVGMAAIISVTRFSRRESTGRKISPDSGATIVTL